MEYKKENNDKNHLSDSVRVEGDGFHRNLVQQILNHATSPLLLCGEHARLERVHVRLSRPRNNDAVECLLSGYSQDVLVGAEPNMLGSSADILRHVGGEGARGDACEYLNLPSAADS